MFFKKMASIILSAFLLLSLIPNVAFANSNLTCASKSKDDYVMVGETLMGSHEVELYAFLKQHNDDFHDIVDHFFMFEEPVVNIFLTKELFCFTADDLMQRVFDTSKPDSYRGAMLATYGLLAEQKFSPKEIKQIDTKLLTLVKQQNKLSPLALSEIRDRNVIPTQVLSNILYESPDGNVTALIDLAKRDPDKAAEYILVTLANPDTKRDARKEAGSQRKKMYGKTYLLPSLPISRVLLEKVKQGYKDGTPRDELRKQLPAMLDAVYVDIAAKKGPYTSANVHKFSTTKSFASLW